MNLKEKFYRAFLKPLPFWVILFGNPKEWYRKRCE